MPGTVQRAALRTVAVIGIALWPAPTLSTENIRTAQLNDLVYAIPDGREVPSWYKKARTIGDIKLANAQLANEIAKAGSVESALANLRSEFTRSCRTVTRYDISQIQIIVAKMQSFQKVLFDVQSELKKSVELMRRNASMEKPGMATFKLRHDVPVYEAAFNQFVGLQVNAREIEKGLNALATNIPKAADGCGPTLIPPLFSQADEPGAKVAPRAPTGGGTTLAREPVRADVRRLWWRP